MKTIKSIYMILIYSIVINILYKHSIFVSNTENYRERDIKCIRVNFI